MESGLEIDKQTIVKTVGSTIKVPSEVMFELEDGRAFLKLRPSHFAIVKTICLQVKETNFSLASGDKMKQLQTMAQEAVASKLEELQTAREAESAEQELFAGVQARKKRGLQPESVVQLPTSLDVSIQEKVVALTSRRQFLPRMATCSLQSLNMKHQSSGASRSAARLICCQNSQ